MKKSTVKKTSSKKKVSPSKRIKKTKEKHINGVMSVIKNVFTNFERDLKEIFSPSENASKNSSKNVSKNAAKLPKNKATKKPGRPKKSLQNVTQNIDVA